MIEWAQRILLGSDALLAASKMKINLDARVSNDFRVDYPGSEGHFGGHISGKPENRGRTESSRRTPNSKLGYI